MDKRISLLLLTVLLATVSSYSQDKSSTAAGTLFQHNSVMPIYMRYSNKDIKKETNDSTFIISFLKYEKSDLEYDSIEVRLRKRGNFRLKNCYYAPLKIKIKKKDAKGSLFEGHKNLKLVLPCKVEKDRNDSVLKEYLAYRFYEIISPYHFKTRLVDLTFEEDKGKKIKLHRISGFLIEDDKNVAKRMKGKVIDSHTHPLNQASLESVRNAFFQYMIGNTDFSTAYLHNCKLIQIENKVVPVPYDFDMSGMVNTSYATVSQINDQKLEIEDVTQRVYRGFKRNPRIYIQIRKEFLEKQADIIEEIEKLENRFENERKYKTTVKYINEFFEILQDDKLYDRYIISVARLK